MHKKIYFISWIAFLFSTMTMQAQIAIIAERIHTVTDGTIENGVILIEGQKIQTVGTADRVDIPANYTRYEAAVVTPGLIDGHSVVGLSGHLNIPTDQDQLEKSSPIQPELRAIDAYNASEELVSFLRSQGITTLHTGHGPGALISGQTMVAKTTHGTIVEVTLIPESMLAITLGSGVSRNFRSPGTRAKGVAMLREELIKAQSYNKKMANEDESKRPDKNLKMEALSNLLQGKTKALIHANTAVDIQSAFRLADEFGFKLVIDGGAEIYDFIDKIKAQGAEVILHPTMARANGDMKNMNMETGSLLAKSGIPFSLQSGYEGYVPKTRVVRFEAAMAAAYGMSFDDALKTITINPAKILGLDDRLGSITPGKDADLVLYDGDPFEYLTHVCKVFINGELVESLCDD